MTNSRPSSVNLKVADARHLTDDDFCQFITLGVLLSVYNTIRARQRVARVHLRQPVLFFTAVLAMGLCLSVRLSVTSRCFIETADRIEHAFGM